MTQAQFGAAIFISQAHLSRIESDELEITEQAAFVIEVVFNYKKDWVLNGIEPKMVSAIKFRESFSSKIEEWNHLVRRIEKIPNAKSIIEKYIKLTDKDRVTIDQIISRLSEM
ncbi:DNA-binding helix-turn-helix protein [Leptospira borgpetersenii serovar Javanica str. UI 09931]|uniref:DNA-binding helix-turn-helix protein n=1 Tax=Leptospira borgpetersenii serovar Javanica str. UI 09931 TaxID=1049767 RepID=A0AAV3JCJ5_LEPBO|nr:DNA-binding helix-turn-helix protein [Leptospira borgpetersenii str. UI 09149]EKR01524.1 DNA-binding helix-turn-helix protein [Leptospira borgpetersenii serovar Castellonis str. 200801910]EMK11213.1 DNA-binding helix-turn-helix protein [Leptospira sp. serovar Kenya str. Sh9]EMN15165.1 DNA-binding helix-turn-helix protein [Leptospira borgpetersenii str. Brem 307]EMN57626.1 DNA-binding helix-turn-helix protein [Leptospira borgpetersenii serovar Javanica str. MK146]EPG57540.1 DNA-binding helix